MLTSEFSLWSGGPNLTLGAYLICWKYAFSVVFLAWAFSCFFWSSRTWIFCGTLLLATLGVIGLGVPLMRPYGLVDGGGALSELAMPMVTAVRGTPSEGWLVAQSNPSPFWSLLVAAIAGFDAERLVSLYRWIPAVVQVVLAVTLFVWMSSLEPSGRARRWGGPLAVFSVLFLSDHRLGFVENDANLWTEALWLRPRIAFALGLLFAVCALLGRARRLWSFVAAGILLALTAWTEPQIALLGGLGAIACEAGRWQRGENATWKTLAALLLPLTLFVWAPAPLLPSSSVTSRSWLLAWNGLCAVTLDRGLIFALAVYGFVVTARDERSRSSDLLLGVTTTSFVLYTMSLASAEVGAWLDRDLLRTCLSILLVALAGLGIAYLADRIGLVAGDSLALTGKLGRKSGDVVLVAFLVGSLPWTFPYWWYPVRMDAAYQASLVPVSRQRLEFASWIRSNTPSDAAFVAGPAYGPWIGALAGRRVLLVEDSRVDSWARHEAQSTILESREPAEVRASVKAWGVTHLAWGRLDGELPRTSPLFREEYRQRRWVTVYVVVR